MEKISLSQLDFAKLCGVLNSGGVVMHPTETCYGLAADIFNKSALKRLYKIKKMSESKPVTVLVGSLDMARKYGIFSEKALLMAEKYWPGPLSIVVARSPELPDFFNPKEEYVSLRFSSYPFCSKMVNYFGGPLTTTSANISGQRQLYEIAENVLPVDLVIDGGKIQQREPSTIVKIVGDRLTILRQGDIFLKNEMDEPDN